MQRILVRSRRAILFLACFVVMFLLLACDLASLTSQGTAPTEPAPTTAAQSKPTAAAEATKAPSTAQPTAKASSPTSAPPSGESTQRRISESLLRLVSMQKKTLPSYHFEANGSIPVWFSTAKKIGAQTMVLKADVMNDNVHMAQTTKWEKEESTEGYIMGMGTSDTGGKSYAVVNGQVKENLASRAAWSMFQMYYGTPLILAAVGPAPAGEETIDGRPAEKYNLDSSQASPEVLNTVRALASNVTSAKGTVWVDKATGALLKMNLDFESEVRDVIGGSKSMGKGTGHLELVVSQVGKVTVKLP